MHSDMFCNLKREIEASYAGYINNSNKKKSSPCQLHNVAKFTWMEIDSTRKKKKIVYLCSEKKNQCKKMMIIIHKINYHVLKCSKCVKRTLLYDKWNSQKHSVWHFEMSLNRVDIRKVAVTSFIYGYSLGFSNVPACMMATMTHSRSIMDRVYFIIRIVSLCIRFNPLLLLLSRYSHFPAPLFSFGIC